MPIFEPDLELLKQVFGNTVQGCHAELIKIPHGWSRVYRVTLFSKGHSIPASAVVKTIDPGGPPTALEAKRELRFYQRLHCQLSIPKPEIYYLGTDKSSGFHVIIMEDLYASHHIPSHPYQWKRAELKSVLHSYARLHTSRVDSMEHAWLAPRHESLIDFEQIPAQVATVQRAGIWGALPELPHLIAYARDSCLKYAREKTVIIHGDTTPANSALPQDLDQPATLIDWQDVGVGLPEFDLAYLDLQPFESARLLPRPELLDLYWCFRADIDPAIPSPEERGARQLHADLVTALWLAGAASRVTLRPYPAGTYPHMHWASQYNIVYNRLKSLALEIKVQ